MPNHHIMGMIYELTVRIQHISNYPLRLLVLLACLYKHHEDEKNFWKLSNLYSSLSFWSKLFPEPFSSKALSPFFTTSNFFQWLPLGHLFRRNSACSPTRFLLTFFISAKESWAQSLLVEVNFWEAANGLLLTSSSLFDDKKRKKATTMSLFSLTTLRERVWQ